jgi:hypothetical protein
LFEWKCISHRWNASRQWNLLWPIVSILAAIDLSAASN